MPYVYMAIIAGLLYYALRRQQHAVAPAALEDFQFPQSSEGTPQCVVFGDVWIKDWMVLGVGNYRTSPIRK